MDSLEPDERAALRAKLVRELVELGMEEEDAHFAISLHLGESQGDVTADPPLTLEEFRAMGLDREFLFRPRPALTGAARRGGSDR